MRSMITLTVAVMLLSMAATAELQNVEIDGTIHIRGHRADYDDLFSYDIEEPNGVRLEKQPMMYGSSSEFTWINQRTQLGVRADFSDDVSAYIQFDSFSVWGEDFRSTDWESGYDDRATIEGSFLTSGDMAEVEVYQSYIEARNMWGTMLNMRIGRQELVFGSEFLMGNNDDAYLNRGLSWDAIRVDYATDMFTITGVAAKHQEDVFGDLFEEDANLYMLYASYTGLEDIVIDAYGIWVEDDEDDEDILTVGLRGAGVIGPVDFDAEVAYQDQNEGFGDDEFLGANLEIGYTLDIAWMPRLYVGGAFFEGSGVYGFHRLFSDMHYSNFIFDLNATISDAIIGRIGVGVQPTENITSSLEGIYIEEEDGNGTLGIEIVMKNTYHYSEDLAFSLTNAYLMGDDAIDDEDLLYNSIAAEISF